MHLTFTEPQYASLAYRSWKVSPEWVAMFDYTSCSDTLTTIKVVKMDYDGAKKITIPNIEIPTESVVDEFQFDVSAFQNDNGTSQNGPTPWQSGDENGKEVNFGLNYDTISKTIKNRLLKLFDTKYGYAACSDCFALGTMKYGAVFKGKGLKIESYSFFANGEISANMDLEVRFYAGKEVLNESQNLLGMDFGLIGSPGLFALQSSVMLDTGIAINNPVSTQDIVAKIGFDVSIPFDISIKSGEGLWSKVPKLKGDYKPKITPHSYNSTQVKYSAEARLTPSIDFGFSLLGKKIGYAFALDTGLGAQLVLGNPQCPEALSLELYQFGNAMVKLNFLDNNQTNVVSSVAKAKIECPFCNKCPIKNIFAV